MSDQHTDRHVAVFGDAHGHLRLLLQLCRLWQLAHGRRLDGVVQCGDLGYFPDPSVLDKATIRHAKEDPEELGFSRYFGEGAPEADNGLIQGVIGESAEGLDRLVEPVIWCHGNHEDFPALQRFAAQADPTAAVDQLGVLHWLPPGAQVEVAGLRVAGIGGAPEPLNDDGARPSERVHKFVDTRACEVVTDARAPFEVLLTHGAPQGIGGEADRSGSELLRMVDQICGPAYHFFGHHRDVIEPARIGETRCYWLDDVNFLRGHNGRFGRVRPRCMGVLRWSGPEDHAFEYVEDQSWYKQVHAQTWEHL